MLLLKVNEAEEKGGSVWSHGRNWSQKQPQVSCWRLLLQFTLLSLCISLLPAWILCPLALLRAVLRASFFFVTSVLTSPSYLSLSCAFMLS